MVPKSGTVAPARSGGSYTTDLQATVDGVLRSSVALRRARERMALFVAAALARGHAPDEVAAADFEELRAMAGWS